MKFKGLIALASVLALAGCAAPSPNPTSSNDGKLHIVTSTNVWADITKTIAGDNFEVTAILANPNQDPHSYEATPKDQLAVSKADLVIAACNSTDSFIEAIAKPESLLCLAPAEDNHGEDGGHSDHSADENPHVWYSLRKTVDAAAMIQAALEKLDSAQAETFQSNYHTFEQQAATMLDWGNQYLANNQLHIAKEFIATESIADELLIELGFANVTPADVVQAGLNETDLSPKQLEELKQKLWGNLFVYNASQTSAQTEGILTFLKDQTCNDTPVPEGSISSNACAAKAKPLGFYEQLPAAMHYLDWMDSNIKQILGKATDTVFN